jgi:hypothetical protein
MRTIHLGLLFAILTLVARNAVAMSTSVAPLVGVGIGRGYLLGFGGRAGVTLDSSVYFGGTFVYHFGEMGSSDPYIWYAGGEAGYETVAQPFKVRPYFGLAYANLGNVCSQGGCSGGRTSQGDALVFPGVTFILPIDVVFVGLDVRYMLLVGEGQGALGTYLTAGFAF